MTSDITVQCPDCGALPGAGCFPNQSHATRRIKGLVFLKHPDFAKQVDWADLKKFPAWMQRMVELAGNGLP